MLLGQCILIKSAIQGGINFIHKSLAIELRIWIVWLLIPSLAHSIDCASCKVQIHVNRLEVSHVVEEVTTRKSGLFLRLSSFVRLRLRFGVFRKVSVFLCLQVKKY